MSKSILAVNAGSSTLKIRLYVFSEQEDEARTETLLAEGSVDRIGTGEAQLYVRYAGQSEIVQSLPAASPADALEQALALLLKRQGHGADAPVRVDAAGYRIAHG